MKIQLTILTLLMAILGSSIKAAPIVITGQVLDSGNVAASKWVSLQNFGADTMTVTDSLGIYTCTINPSSGVGVVIATYVGSCGDTITKQFPFTQATRMLRIDFDACNGIPVIVEGNVLNSHLLAPGSMAFLSYRLNSLAFDSIPIDSIGWFSKSLSLVPSNTLFVSLTDCRQNRLLDSASYSAGDTLTFQFDYCDSNAVTPKHNGRVLLRGAPLSGDLFHILCYQYNSISQQLNFSDTLEADSLFGNWSLDKDSSDYLIKVIPRGNNYAFGPSYYQSGWSWQGTSSFVVGPHSSTSIDINVWEVSRQIGLGIVSGNVVVDSLLEKAGFMGVGLVLLDEFQNPLDYTYADLNGKFQFDSLPDGKYKIALDQCGIPSETSNAIEIGINSKEVSGITVYASPEKTHVTGLVSVQNFKQESSLEVYPNPVSNQLNIKANGIDEIDIYTLSGRVYERFFFNYENMVQVDFTDKPPGVYLVKVKSDDGWQIQRVIK